MGALAGGRYSPAGTPMQPKPELPLGIQAGDPQPCAPAGRDRGPLHGVPISIKDLLDVTGTPTTAASRVRAGHRAAHDAAAVATWAERLAAVRASGKDVYAYFRHDEDGSNGLAAEALRDALA